MLKNYDIKLEKNITEEAKTFVMKNHYLKSVARGCNRVAKLYVDGKLKGVAMYGIPVSRLAKSKYGTDLELKRFVLSSDLPKNSGSWFISKTMKMLKQLKHKAVLSYADPSQGHEGTLYKAANFQYLGKQLYPTQYYIINGKRVYSRNAHNGNKRNDWLKLIRAGKIKSKCMPKKHIFKFEIKK